MSESSGSSLPSSPAAQSTTINPNEPSTSSAATSPVESSSSASTGPVASTIDRLLGIPAGCKVVVHFRATGDAPILKKHKFQLNASSRFIVLIEFLRKHLHYKPSDPLFLFVNAAFAPTPDALVYDLFKSFSINNELVVHYATQDAWG